VRSPTILVLWVEIQAIADGATPMSLLSWKRTKFPRGIKRDSARFRNRLFNRTTRKRLTSAFKELDMPSGAVVGIHARLSSLGYLTDGPSSVLRALQEAVPDCTILMPTFPFAHTTLEYLTESPVFDADNTPSSSGVLSEALRTLPGTLRSRHPTHPCAANGPAAPALIDGSEASKTPFGDDSAYGRYTSHPKAFQLLLDTNSTSIVHRFQELVHTPNLFLDDDMEARALDTTGQVTTRIVRVHRPVVPLYVAVPSDQTDEFQYVWMPDYCLLFPSAHRARVLKGLVRSDVARSLRARDEAFERNGVFRRTHIRSAEILAIEVQPWLTTICHDLAENLHRHSAAYTLKRVEAAVGK
jgi:aminoglycoside N3'-acetyltransferase